MQIEQQHIESPVPCDKCSGMWEVNILSYEKPTYSFYNAVAIYCVCYVNINIA